MPEPDTIQLDVPGGGQLEISRCKDKKVIATVASCGDERTTPIRRIRRRRWGKMQKARMAESGV